jgi:hypothetical protein
MLGGKKVAALYEGQPLWRQRYGLDEYGVARVGKVVSRTSASLPSLVLWALAPKEPESRWLFADANALLFSAPACLTLLLAAGAVFALLRGRGVGACLLLAATTSVVIARLTAGALVASSPTALQALFGGATVVAPLALCAAVFPIARPVWRYLRGR